MRLKLAPLLRIAADLRHYPDTDFKARLRAQLERRKAMSIAVLEACPEGTAVVNDWPGVLRVAERKTAEHGVADRVELRPGDFHEIAIESGAYDIVVLGHVCRTEGDARSRRLVARDPSWLLDRAFAGNVVRGLLARPGRSNRGSAPPA